MPTKDFKQKTTDEVRGKAAAEQPSVMPGSGRKVPGPWTALLHDMESASAATVGDLGEQKVGFHAKTTKEVYGKLTKTLSDAMRDPDLTKAKQGQPKTQPVEPTDEEDD